MTFCEGRSQNNFAKRFFLTWLFEKSGAAHGKARRGGPSIPSVSSCSGGSEQKNDVLKVLGPQRHRKCVAEVRTRQKSKVLPRFELGLEESEPSVITNYTIGPLNKQYINKIYKR